MPEPSFSKIGAHPNDPEGHVFFVHGFKGHDVKTWIVKGALEGWPQWLSREFPKLAVWSIKYQTGASTFCGGNMSLRERAIQLFEEMGGIGLLDGKPKLFICHSLGGLVVKQILRTAAEDFEPRERGDAFIDSVKGIVFLGTPHKGSRWANVLQFWFGLMTNSKALKDLKTNNEVLKSLYQWFRIHNQKWAVKSFYETKKLKALILIVPEESADPGFLHSVTDLVPLDADHLSICKPKDNLEQQYVTSRNIIKEIFAQEARRIVVKMPPKAPGGAFAKIAAASLFLAMIGTSILVMLKGRHVAYPDPKAKTEIRADAWPRGIKPDLSADVRTADASMGHEINGERFVHLSPQYGISQSSAAITAQMPTPEDVSTPLCIMHLSASEILLGETLEINACGSCHFEKGVITIHVHSGAIIQTLDFSPENCMKGIVFDEPGTYLIGCRVEGGHGRAESEAVVEVLKPPSRESPPHPTLFLRRGGSLVDVCLTDILKSSKSLSLHLGYRYGMSERFYLAARAGIHFPLDENGHGKPLSLDALAMYKTGRFWINAGLGVWLAKGDSKMDIVSGLGLDLARMGALQSAVYLESRLAVKGLFQRHDSSRLSLGIRLALN